MRARAAYQHTGMRKPFRVAWYTIGVLMIFAAVGAVLQQFGILHRPGVGPAPAEERYVPNIAPRPSVVVPAPITGKIAPSLPVGEDGRISVICPRVAGGSGSMMRVLPGTYVDCADGVPQFAPGT